MYKYKNLETGKIVIKDEPIKGKKKFEYQLLGWVRNTSIDTKKITKKVAKKKTAKKTAKKTNK